MTVYKQRKTKPIRKNAIPESLQGQVYLDPRFDTGFKELFDSKDALKDFLDGVLQLEGDDKIKGLTFSFDKTITIRSSLSKKVILGIFAKNKYIMISLPKFKKSEGEVNCSVDAWLYLLNHAGDGKELPDFGNEVLGEALERIRVDNADDELLTKQEKDMVTQEEIETRVASGILRGREQGIDILEALGVSSDLIEKARKIAAEKQQELK